MTQVKYDGKDYDKAYGQFIEWLETADDLNEKYFELVEAGLPIFSEYAKEKEDSVSLHVLVDFLIRLGTIKNGLLLLARDGNYYSMCIVYRSYLEHWLKGTYIWVRHSKEKDNTVGSEFWNLLKLGEELKYGTSLKHMAKMMDHETKDIDLWQYLCKHLPGLKSLGQESIKQAVTNFDYKNILRYLKENNAPGSDLIPAVVSDYAEHSSFVHGGPSTVNSYASLKHFKECEGMIRFSINMTAIYTFSVLALVLRDKGEKERTEKINEILPKLIKIRV